MRFSGYSGSFNPSMCYSEADMICIYRINAASKRCLYYRPQKVVCGFFRMLTCSIRRRVEASKNQRRIVAENEYEFRMG